MGWLDEDEKTLAELWAAGWSAEQIRPELKGTYTRSALCAKIARDLPPRRAVAAQGRAKQKPRTPRTTTGTTAAKGSPEPANIAARADGEASRIGASPEPEPPAGQAPRGLTIIELERDSCRWPLGDPMQASFRFCGNPGADFTASPARPYCSWHHERAYTPMPPRRRALQPLQRKADHANPTL